jgi:repressor LexA
MPLPTSTKEVELTKRQEEILAFIKTHIEKSGFPPTILEIQEEFSFKSPNAVQEHVKAIARKGYIRRNPNKWRGLELVGVAKKESLAPPTVLVPLIGHVAAGSPILAEENIEGMISVDRSLVRRATKLFALHVHGDSMINAGIYSGDIVVAQQQSVANDGDIVIALLGDEATVKKFYRKNKAIILHPENDTMRPIKVNGREDFRVLGKVIATLRRL